MRTAVLLLCCAAVYAAPQASTPGKLDLSRYRNELQMCGKAMKTDISQDDLIRSCIADQGIPPSLTKNFKGIVGRLTGQDGKKAERPTGSLIDQLRRAGLGRLITKVMKCVAETKGFLVNGRFNMPQLIDGLTAIVAGTGFETRVAAGTSMCGVVVDYDVPRYLKCVVFVCATGQTAEQMRLASRQ